MNTEKLLKLADLMDNIALNIRTDPEKTVRLDLTCWVSKTDDDEYHNDDEHQFNCGTQACAVGAAALSGLFPGLELSHGLPCYSGVTGWSAVREYFRLDSLLQACYLFSEDYYGKAIRGAAAAELVAARIRVVCEDGFPHNIRIL